MNPLVVYTTVLGETDDLQPPACPVSVPFRCFTDNPSLKVPGWEMIVIPLEADPTKQSRRMKILSHETVPDAYATLWTDCAFTLRVDPLQVLSRWMWQYDMLALKHPWRDNIVDEAKELVRLDIVDREPLDRQMGWYTEAGFDVAHSGLTSSGFCLRRSAPRVVAFNKRWWKCFDAAGHTRDQMSIDYAAWKTGLDVMYLTGNYRDNPYASWKGKKRRPRR